MLVRCLYASHASAPITGDLVRTILEQSRRNNLPNGVTGILCFIDRTFIQVLEGGRDEVSELLAKILSDARHSGLRILLFEEISERCFSNWSMAQIDAAKANQGLLLKYSAKAEIDPFSSPGRATMALIDDLVASGCVSRV